MKAMLSLPQSLSRLLARMKQAGFSAYAVGGCVRDSVLGRQVSDWDVTTSATPDEIKAVFSDCRIIDTGIQHGTVTVMFENASYEVTVFRVDGKYTDGRHPDQVRFSSCLEEDLARRDFTVNAMAYSPDEGIIDPFGGMEDIAKGILRAVGVPGERFTEDALRILRCIRFASTLGFSIERTTAEAMTALSPRLSLVSAERITTEITKAILGENAHTMFMQYHEVLKNAWPSLANKIAYDYGVGLLPYLPKELDIRLSALFFGVEQAQRETHFLNLRLNRETSRTVSTLCELLTKPLPDTHLAQKQMLGQYGNGFCQKLALLWKANCIIKGETPAMVTEISHNWQEWTEQNICVSLASLAVSGGDLRKLGVKEGVALGHWLKELLLAVMDNRIPNEKYALLAYVAEQLRL